MTITINYTRQDFEAISFQLNEVKGSVCRNHNPVISSFTTYHLVFDKSNTMGASSGAWTAYPSQTSESTPSFSGYCATRPLVFCTVFCRSLFVLFYFAHCIVCSSIYGFWLSLCFFFKLFLWNRELSFGALKHLFIIRTMKFIRWCIS